MGRLRRKERRTLKKKEKKKKPKFTPIYDIFYGIKNFEIRSNMKISVSIMASIMLAFVLILSLYHGMYGSDLNRIAREVQERNFMEAEKTYERLLKKSPGIFDGSMEKRVSKKLTRVMIDTGESFIYKGLSKESFIGTVNTINSLRGVYINTADIVNQSKTVYKAFVNDQINYDKASTYIEVVSELNRVEPYIIDISSKIDSINESRHLFTYAEGLEHDFKYYDAAKYYKKVLKADSKYTLAHKKVEELAEKIPVYYSKQARVFEGQGNYRAAIECCRYVLEYDPESIDTFKYMMKLIKNDSGSEINKTDIVNLYKISTGDLSDNIKAKVLPVEINDKKYYAAYLSGGDKIPERKTLEILVRGDNNDIYIKPYQVNYIDKNFEKGYFKSGENGKYTLSLSSAQIDSKFKTYLKDKKIDYGDCKVSSFDEIKSDLSENIVKSLEKKKDENIYFVVGSGIFSKNIYSYNILTNNILKVK